MRDIKSCYTMSQGNQRSVKRGKNLELIPTDLIMEIFSRLPSKSIARFRTVSKQWRSMLDSPYFTELFRTRPSAGPRLLFAVEGDDSEWLFYSTPQHQNPYEKKFLVVAADYHTKFSGHIMYREDIIRCASGLIYFPEWNMSMICNPITGQYVTLPKPDGYIRWTTYLGFDPIDKQFKVLAETYPFCDQRDNHKVLTLGTGKLMWRNNSHCPRYSQSFRGEGLCINGVLYYLAQKGGGDFVIVCFDVRSEKFKFIDAECFRNPCGNKLINYKGKLGAIAWDCSNKTCKLRMWVLEDMEKQEWSKYVYTFPKHEVVVSDSGNLDVVGVTATGEIVLSKEYTSKPFYVYYFIPERNTLQRIEIQGFEESEHGFTVKTFVDYVEDLRFNDAKQLKSSIYAPSVKKKKKKKRSQNIITR